MKTPEILYNLRKGKKLSQQAVADYLGVSSSAYQTYEYGKAELNYEGLTKLAEFYGVSTDYLLGREPPANPFDMIAVDTASKNTMEMFASLPEATRKIILDAMVKLAHAAEEAEQEDPDRVEYTCGELEDSAAAQQDGGKFA